jgi:hypothetical protein
MTSRSTRGWRVHWFHTWETVLDDALRALPEHPQWPNSLLRVLFEAPGSVPKKVALLIDRDGTPAALVGLRLRAPGMWEPLATYIVPGFLIVGHQDLTAAALTALSTNLRVAWWRMPAAPPSPSYRGIRSSKAVPTHILDLNVDPEIYWHASRFLDTCRKARRKSAALQFVVNPPDGLQWTLRNSDEKWRRDPAAAAIDLGDRLAADQFLQERGQHFTLALVDGEELVAAEACVVDRGELATVTCYLRPEYRAHMAGWAVLIHICDWARQSGFSGFDIGGGNFDYKVKFAPPRGEKTELLMCPALEYRVRQVMTYTGKVRDALDGNLPRRSYQWLQRGLRNRLLGSTASSS